MKLSHLSAAVMAMIIAATAATLNAQSSQGYATVSRIHGAARYSTGNNVWQTLHEGDTLKPGAAIQTASESWADIVLGGEGEISAPTPIVRRFVYSGTQDTQKNVVRLRENTVLGIDKLSSEQTGADTVTDTQLDLRAGRIFFNVKKLSAASKYEIKLPNGVAGIRGTLGELSSSGLLVYFGSVVMSYYDANGQLVTKVVMAGQQLDCTTGIINNLPGGDIDQGKREGGQISGGAHGGGAPGQQGSGQGDDHGQNCISPIVDPSHPVTPPPPV